LNKGRDKKVAEHHFTRMYELLQMADKDMEGRIDRSFESSEEEEEQQI